MADLTFASFAQGPLGEAIKATDDMGTLPVPAFAPTVTLVGPAEETAPVKGPDMRLLGPGDIARLLGGSVVRVDPPDGSVDVEPNYLAAAEIVPVELAWMLTPARAANGRLRPWLVLVVVAADRTPLVPGSPLPTIEADVAELPDLRDSWGWAHVQRTTGSGALPGGGQAAAGSVARLVCPRRLAAGITYRACLVPAFGSGVAAGRGDVKAHEAANDLAWTVEAGGSVTLPVYHSWTFTTGPDGDFEQLVTRLRAAEPEALRISSARLVDVRAPWPSDQPLADSAQLVEVQGALCPLSDPPVPDPQVSAPTLAAFDTRIRAQLDAPAQRILHGVADDTTGTLAPPLYGGRHVAQDLVEGGPVWLAQLNTSIANRIAAGLGTQYIRTNQEDLMARAWEQVGAIREANRLQAVVELTTEVATKVHARHVASLLPGELVALSAPAAARTRTADATTLATEVRMSRLIDGAASSAFARRVRPAGKLARRTGVTVGQIVPRALAGDVSVPGEAPVISATPVVQANAVAAVSSAAAASQLVQISALARVAAVNSATAAGVNLTTRLASIGLSGQLMSLVGAGDIRSVAAGITADVGAVATVTSQALNDMGGDAFGSVSQFGVKVDATRLAGRVSDALHPGDSHWARLDTQLSLPDWVSTPQRGDPIMACPQFPIPTALTLLDSDPEWFLPGLGALPMNRVALLRQNEEFIASYLVGLNHEMMRELLWREYPTDRRGTAFTRFWPRPDGAADIDPIPSWLGPAPLGRRLLMADALSVLLVRGNVLRRYPDMVVTAVRSGAPDADGHHRPDPNQPPVAPTFVIKVDASTVAYAFPIGEDELRTPASKEAPGWFFVLAEHSFRIRFGFDETPPAGADPGFTGWNDATWPPDSGAPGAACVPVVREHAIAGLPFGPPSHQSADDPRWNRDAADIARIALQRPFRVAIQADVLLHPAPGED